MTNENQRNRETEERELIFNKKAFHERSEWDASDKEKMKMNDDLCNFRHKKLEYNYIADKVEEMGTIYTAREVDKREFEAIIRLLKENNWKLEVSTSLDGHYIGNGIRSIGPFTTKSMVKTVKKICKEKKKIGRKFMICPICIILTIIGFVYGFIKNKLTK